MHCRSTAALAGAFLLLAACNTAAPTPQIAGPTPGLAPDLTPAPRAAGPGSGSTATPAGALLHVDYLVSTATASPPPSGGLAATDTPPVLPAGARPTPDAGAAGGPTALAPAPRPPAVPRAPHPTHTPHPTRTPHPTHTPRASATPVDSALPSPSASPPAGPPLSSTPVPTGVPIPAAPTDTRTPRPTYTPRPSSTAGLPPGTGTPAPAGRFVVSTHSRKYYYCVSDPAWHTLAPTNLVWYPDEATLQARYPGLVLHAPCTP
ncbi:MAG TPA: hypothetical protein VKY74_24670 [Chloroflexia bacterium]|nr:hypothetical protein [Chloroflexia bacterium]